MNRAQYFELLQKEFLGLILILNTQHYQRAVVRGNRKRSARLPESIRHRIIKQLLFPEKPYPAFKSASEQIYLHIYKKRLTSIIHTS